MNITNEREVMIFKKEENGKVKYSVQISKKQASGEYENAYMQIQFNQGVELQDRQKIKIKGAWISFYKWEHQGNKGTTFFIKCNSFEDAEDGQANNQVVAPSQFESHGISDEPFNDMANQFDGFGETVELSEDDIAF